MEVRTAVTSECTASPHVSGQQVDGAHAYESLYRGNEWKPAVPKQRLRQRALSKQKTWAYFFSVVAVSLVLLACLRASRLRASSLDVGRRLAGRLREKEDDGASAILDMCLDMQEEGGDLNRLLTPMPTSSRAIPLIVEYLAEGMSEAGPHPQASGPSVERPLESSVPARSLKPGFSHVGAASLDAEGRGALGDGDLNTAAAGTSDARATATFHFPPHPDEEGLAPVSAHVGRALQTLWLLPEQQFGPGSFPETVIGPSSSSPTSGITSTALQEPLPQRTVPTAPCQPGAAQPTSGWKRGVSDPVSSRSGIAAKPQEEQSAWERPQPKKHTSGWKRKRPLSPSEPPRLPADQRPHPRAAEALDEDPLLSEAMRAVPVALSAPSLDVADSAGDARQKAGKQGKEDLLSKAVEAVPQELFIPWLEISPSEPQHVADKELPSTSAASVSFSSPAAPLDFGPTLDASVEASLAEPSTSMPTEASPAQPLSPSDDSGSPPAASASHLPASAYPYPPTAHPFYRLPVLQPGPITLIFNPDRAFSSGNRTLIPFIPFFTMRGLLIRPEISASDARALIRHSESLAGRLYYDLVTPTRCIWPKDGVVYMGRLFLFMDMLLRAIEVVGSPMNAQAWWPRLAQVVPSRTVFSPRRKKWKKARFHADLATRLSSAVQSLKEGIRLTAEETVSLTRDLLCNEETVEEFKHRRWDPWRHDDAGSGAPPVP